MKYYLSIGVSIKSATINYTLNKSKTVWRINNSSFLKFFFYAILFWTVTLTWHQPFLFSGHHERFWNFLCFLEDQGQMLANMPSKLTIGEFFFILSKYISCRIIFLCKENLYRPKNHFIWKDDCFQKPYFESLLNTLKFG